MNKSLTHALVTTAFHFKKSPSKMDMQEAKANISFYPYLQTYIIIIATFQTYQFSD